MNDATKEQIKRDVTSIVATFNTLPTVEVAHETADLEIRVIVDQAIGLIIRARIGNIEAESTRDVRDALYTLAVKVNGAAYLATRREWRKAR